MRPLEGVRIADLTWLMAGAGGLKLMSALGAEVIRVEWHGRMDWLRFHAQTPIPYRQPDHAPLDPQSPNRSGYFNSINAGKYGVSLNVKHPEGRELFKRLVGIWDSDTRYSSRSNPISSITSSRDGARKART
jgi:crotonobetainyl-CoA:carnitine CoA-transferase CaiB-like acyl-CoA transferase